MYSVFIWKQVTVETKKLTLFLMNKIHFTETNPQFVGYAGIRV